MIGDSTRFAVGHWTICVACLYSISFVSEINLKAADMDVSTTQLESGADNPLPETFVLAPIRISTTSMQVPAAMVAPVTNNSCRRFIEKTENCYLPAEVLTKSIAEKEPWIFRLLEKHVSALLGAWKVGSWPADGASVVFPLEQYQSMHHLWLTTRIDITESIGGCWLDGRDDPAVLLDQATAQPAAHIALEVFSSTRNAAGYPSKKGL